MEVNLEGLTMQKRNIQAVRVMVRVRVSSYGH